VAALPAARGLSLNSAIPLDARLAMLRRPKPLLIISQCLLVNGPIVTNARQNRSIHLQFRRATTYLEVAKRNHAIQTIPESAHGMAVCAIRCLGDLGYLASAWSRTP
jgi:hypothetical protein